MSAPTPPTDRDGERLRDLTRWNRAGLRRFDYVDGNAAVWLEELRIALMGLIAHGASPELRLPEAWRETPWESGFRRPSAEEVAAFASRVPWNALKPSRPPGTGAELVERPGRLEAQYAAGFEDGGQEILRAFARASHVLLGHLDAFANEGFIATATQWENVRRLARMVNHQPTPPASATMPVGLVLDEGAATTRIERGLAMRHGPKEGGAPLVFETIAAIDAHPRLNDLRLKGATFDPRKLSLASGPDAGARRFEDEWLADDSVAIVPGALAVLTADRGTASSKGAAVTLESVGERTDGSIGLGFDLEPELAPARGEAVLAVDPVDVRSGTPRSGPGRLVVAIPGASQFGAGTIVKVYRDDGVGFGTVESNTGGFLILGTRDTAEGSVTIEAMTPYPEAARGSIATEEGVDRLYYAKQGGGYIEGPTPPEDELARRSDDEVVPGKVLRVLHTRPEGAIGVGFAVASKAVGQRGKVVKEFAPPVVRGAEASNRVVRFEGKPPKGCEAGSWFVARTAGQGLLALRLAGVGIDGDGYSLEFTQDAVGDDRRPEDTEFHGPMRHRLRPRLHDRNPTAIGSAHALDVDGLDEASRGLLKPGRRLLLRCESGPPANGGPDDGAPEAGARAGQATVVQVEHGTDESRLSVESDVDFSAWPVGWTRVNANVVDASHGETKPPKVLGSGDGERLAQRFRLKAGPVSFVPSNAAESGVVPDMDVTVDGVRWEHRDAIDFTADGLAAYSTVLTDDGELDLVFRRRLPTGVDNVRVARYRIGAGEEGNAVPAGAIVEPMKKHPQVVGIVQPFGASGGADREPVSRMREAAPARIAANGRAVTLADHARLAARHASVREAVAFELPTPGLERHVRLVVVPAGEDRVGGTLLRDLTSFVQNRSLPGTRVYVEVHEVVGLQLEASIRVDESRFDRDDTRMSALAALRAAFSPVARRLGQPAYRSEVMAALEAVEGVSTVVVERFSRDASAPAVLSEARLRGELHAIHPFGHQLLALHVPSEASVRVESA